MGTFDDLAAGWPPRVVTYYRDLAGRRHWPETVIDAIAEHVEYYRLLSMKDRPRSCWHGTFPEEGSEWFFETVIDADGTNAVLRQVVNEADGRVGRYSWECIEDDDGGLSEVALDESLPRLEAIPGEDFEAEWRRAAGVLKLRRAQGFASVPGSH